MNDIKKGDIVVRKSYGKDIIFRVINILNKPEEKNCSFKWCYRKN